MVVTMMAAVLVSMSAMFVMGVTMAPICAALRLKRCFEFCKLRAEAGEHILDHMIGPDAKGALQYLRGKVAVSEMPGEPGELMRIVMANFDNGLGCGPHAEPASIAELQSVTIRHCHRFRQVKQNAFTLIGDHL
jgi:hypothetical protein